MRRKKKQIDYIFICQKWGRWNRIIPLLETVAGISVLKLMVTEPRKRIRNHGDIDNASEYLQKKLKKVAKWYQIEHCVVGADFAMTEKLQLMDASFQARKKELLDHGKELIQGRGMDNVTNFEWKSFLLVLDSEQWSQQEVLLFLMTAKEYYIDLNIVVKKNKIKLEQMAAFLYDEWGIVLHILPEKTAMKSKMDFALFLLERWKDAVYGYSINKGYVVAENERGMIRSRRNGNLYTGFVYECDGQELPYQMAVDIFYQNPELYNKFAITFIDIYSL